jgi:hypothetical protein
MKSFFSAITYPIKWVSQIFCECEKHGSKPSYARIFGAVDIIMIMRNGCYGKPIPDAWITVFWVLVGYQFLSKAIGPDGIKAILMRTAPLGVANPVLASSEPQKSVVQPPSNG